MKQPPPPRAKLLLLLCFFIIERSNYIRIRATPSSPSAISHRPSSARIPSYLLLCFESGTRLTKGPWWRWSVGSTIQYEVERSNAKCVSHDLFLQGLSVTMMIFYLVIALGPKYRLKHMRCMALFSKCFCGRTVILYETWKIWQNIQKCTFNPRFICFFSLLAWWPSQMRGHQPLDDFLFYRNSSLIFDFIVWL
jgi:hypothetical protein